MEQNITRKDMWNTAATAGLVLGAVSAAYMFVTQLMAGTSGFMMTILGFLLWAAKFGGCIWLMAFFMKKHAAAHPEVDNKETFRLGMITALLSALVYSAAAFANIAFISGDAIAEQVNLTMQQMGSMMDSNSMSLMETYMEKLPQITFFSNLLYCFVFGTVLSYILSRNIPSRDPFANYKPDQQ
jgi:hypothetical protein